jgi:transposase
MRIWLAVEPVDFLKGIDGLAQVCRQQLQLDSMAGVLVVFSGRRRKALKCLMYDGQGYWLCQKRLSVGKFSRWPADARPPIFGLDAHQLQSLHWNAKRPTPRMCLCGDRLRRRVKRRGFLSDKGTLWIKPPEDVRKEAFADAKSNPGPRTPAAGMRARSKPSLPGSRERRGPKRRKGRTASLSKRTGSQT